MDDYSKRLIRQQIAFDYLTNIRDLEELLQIISRLTLVDIKNTFAEENKNNANEDYSEEDLANMSYEDEEIKDNKAGLFIMKLWKKMVFRFRNCNKDIAVMYNQLTGNFKYLLLYKYKINHKKQQEHCDWIMQFFQWIACSMSTHEICQVFLQSDDIADNWKVTTSIAFFFSLDDTQKETLVKHYVKHFEFFLN